MDGAGLTEARLREQIRARGITRLCHLTPSRNLVHIATANEGILSVHQLGRDERSVFTQQDLARFDQQPDHISCSIQYPNAWYLRHKSNPRGEASNFRDWVVLGLDAGRIALPTTLFSPGNAAEGSGINLGSGIDAFGAMYEAEFVDGKGRSFKRTAKMLAACPTNDQAEVMIHRQIPLTEIGTIFVRDAEQATRQYVGLQQIGADADHFRYVVAPSFFDPYQLSANLRDGVAPTETEWNAPNRDE
jgi:hypothetical protein